MAIIKTRRPIFAISLQNLHIYEEKVGQKVGQKWAKSGPKVGQKWAKWAKNAILAQKSGPKIKSGPKVGQKVGQKFYALSVILG